MRAERTSAFLARAMHLAEGRMLEEVSACADEVEALEVRATVLELRESLAERRSALDADKAWMDGYAQGLADGMFGGPRDGRGETCR